MNKQPQQAPKRLRRCKQCATSVPRLHVFDGKECCHRCLFAEWVNADRRDYAQAIEWCRKLHVCLYCGDPAQDREHVIPRTWGLPTFTVPACSECNVLLGRTLHVSLIDRRNHVRQRLTARYAKLMRMPDWDEDELRGMADHLVESIRRHQDARDWVKGRIAWTMESLVRDDGALRAAQ